ncbi:hypothetical protein BC833DRAFT_272327 [Globomyces pollinis-pini]|nr:hypothetical protein BC833DRAFT_272327 [Globomyces pollinis-pini]
MNGIVNGTKYFECHKNSGLKTFKLNWTGIMVKINCVMPLHFGELDRNKDIKNALPKTNFNLSNKSERQAKSALLVQLSRTLSHLRNRISALENHQSYAIVEFRKLNEKYESFLDPNQNGFSMDEIFDLKKSIDGFLKFVSMDSKKPSQFKWISENKTVQESTPRIQSLNTQCNIDSSNYTPRISISDVGFCGFPKQGDDYLNPIAFELVSSEKTYLKDLILLNTVRNPL